ncbi:MAG: Dabb family protein [Hydrogenophaga sp.]
MLKHIVMWNIQGGPDGGKAAAIERVRAAFETLRGKIPGLIHIEIGVDRSGVDYACDVVLYSEFESQAALDAYATHPEHLRVRQAIEGLRVARHQVDYTA